MDEESFRYKSARWISDATALSVVSTAAGAFFESVVVGMSDEVSLKARIIVTGLNYAGFAPAFTWGRKKLKNALNIVEGKSREITHQIFGACYLLGISLAANPIIYLASGSENASEIVIGTAVAAAAAFGMGGPMDYAVSLYRDLTSLEVSERVPRTIRGRHPMLKAGLAAALIAGSVGLTQKIYDSTPENWRGIVPELQELYQERSDQNIAPALDAPTSGYSQNNLELILSE